MTDMNTLRSILTQYRRIAMVGLSADWSRPSNFVAKYLLEHDFYVIPVNPKYDEILGQKCYPDLAAIPTPVDIVDLFQKAERIPPFVDAAIDMNAAIVWMQLGIVHESAADKARAANATAPSLDMFSLNPSSSTPYMYGEPEPVAQYVSGMEPPAESIE